MCFNAASSMPLQLLRVFRFLAVILWAVAIAACDAGGDSPTSPSTVSPSAGVASVAGSGTGTVVEAQGQPKTTVCHRHPQTGAFAPLSVPSPSVDGHLRHGDGQVGGAVPGSPTKMFGVACELLDVVSVLINGSFETGPNVPTNDINIAGGSTAITGWAVTGSVIDYLNGNVWDVSDGIRAIDLDGNGGTGGIEQTFATVSGQRYQVSFDLSGNPQGAPTVKQMRAAVDAFTQDYSHDSSGQDIGNLVWQTVTFQFVASGTTATLSFTSLSPAGNSYGAAIDNVSVIPIP